MGIANAKNLKFLDEEYKKYKSIGQSEQEKKITQMLFVEENVENIKKKKSNSNSIEKLTESLKILYSDQNPTLKKTKIQKIISNFETLDWYAEIFSQIHDFNFQKKKKLSKEKLFSQKKSKIHYNIKLFQIVENFYMFTYLLIHYKLFDSEIYQSINDFRQRINSFNEIPSLKRRKSSIANISGLIDNSFMRDKSHIFNQKMVIENFMPLKNPKKIDNLITKNKKKYKILHVNPFSNYIEINDLEELAKDKKENWSNGFVYKGIFFKLIKSKSLIDFLNEYIYSHSHQFFNVNSKNVDLNCLFAVHSFFGQAIFVTPLVNVIKHETDYLLHNIKNGIKFRLVLPNIKTFKNISVLYYYSEIHKDESVFLINENFHLKEAFFVSLKLKYLLMFLTKYKYKKIIKRYNFNINEIIFKKSTYFIFKIYNYQKPNLKEINNFAKEVDSHKEINFKYLLYLKKRYNIKAEFFPYILQKISKKKKKLIIIKIFIYLIEKNFKDTSLTNQKNKKIIDSYLFYEYFNKINYSIFNDLNSLYLFLLPYFLVLQIKALIFFPKICFVTDLKTMFDEYHKIIYNNPYLYLECISVHFGITLNRDFLGKLRFENYFISSPNIIENLSLRTFRSFRPLRFLEFELFERFGLNGVFSSPVIFMVNVKNFDFHEFLEWLKKIEIICLSVKTPGNSYKQFLILYSMFLALNYLRVGDYTKFLELSENLTIFQNQKIFRFIHFLLKAIYFEILQKSDLNEKKNLDNNKTYSFENGDKSNKNSKKKNDYKKLSKIFYTKSLQIYMNLFGDPRWKSKITSYFFELLTTKLIQYTTDNKKLINYSEILSSNYKNDDVYLKYKNNMIISGRSREDFINYQNISDKFEFVKNRKINNSLIIELLDYCEIVLLFNNKNLDYFFSENDIIEKYKNLNNVFVWGFNNYGQLGFIPFSDTPLEKLSSNTIIKKRYSSKKSKISESSNNFVDNTQKPKRRKKQSKKYTLPRLLSNFQNRIIKISFGYDNCLALNDKGEVYSWGNNNYGKLGIGMDDLILFPFPKKIKKLEKIEKIICGNNHSLVLGKNNNVWAWGSGTSGELGNGFLKNSIYPRKVQFREKIGKIKKFALGACHSLILDGNGSVFGFGENKFCQISQDLKKKHFVFPVRIFFGEKIKKIKSGETHNLALTINNKVFVWGNGIFGQCGPLGKKNGIISKPTYLNLNFEPVKIYAGSLFSFIKSKEKKFYGFGTNENLELGIKTKNETIFEPLEIKILRDYEIFKLSCGTTHCMAFFKGFKKGVLVWGSNRSWQLGEKLQGNSEVRELEEFRNKDVKDIACGGYHSGLIIH